MPKFSSKVRKQILNRLLESIGDIAELEYVKCTWLESEECDQIDITEPYNECAHMLAGVCKDHNELGISEKQKEILENFDKKLEHFAVSVEEIVRSDCPVCPELDKIKKEANDVLEAFDRARRDWDEKVRELGDIVGFFPELLKQERRWVCRENDDDRLDYYDIVLKFERIYGYISKHYSDLGFSDEQRECVEKFRKDLEAFHSSIKPEGEFYEAEGWLGIVAGAEELLEVLANGREKGEKR